MSIVPNSCGCAKDGFGCVGSEKLIRRPRGQRFVSLSVPTLKVVETVICASSRVQIVSVTPFRACLSLSTPLANTPLANCLSAKGASHICNFAGTRLLAPQSIVAVPDLACPPDLAGSVADF